MKSVPLPSACRRALILAPLPLVVVGTAAAQPSAPPLPSCREAPAYFALGQAYSDQLARRARRRAGAGAVRTIEPGRAYTMEFRADRLTLELDARGRVRAVLCG